MKMISLEEAKKLATPGIFSADSFGTMNDQLVLMAPSGAVALVCGKEATPEDKANAALLAHRWNHFDEVVEQVRVLSLLLAENRGDDDPDVLRAEAVLARAKTVEMP